MRGQVLAQLRESEKVLDAGLDEERRATEERREEDGGVGNGYCCEVRKASRNV